MALEKWGEMLNRGMERWLLSKEEWLLLAM